MSKRGKLAGGFLAVAALTIALLVPVAAYADDTSVTLRAQELEGQEAPTSTVLVYGFVKWDDGGDKKQLRPETVTVHLFSNGVESQSLTFGKSESGQWLFTFEAVPILDSEGKEIVYTVSVNNIPEYESDVAKVGSYAFGITNTLIVDDKDKTVAEVAEAPEARSLTYNGNWQAAGDHHGGQRVQGPGREGYTFKYWKGSQYAAGADYKVEGNHSFTAVWEKSSTADSGNHDKKPLLPATGDNAVALTPCTLMALASLAFLSGSMALRRKDAAYKGKIVALISPRARWQ